MMDIQKLREEFEKLPGIVERIENLDFNEHTKEYESSLMCCSNEAYVNGAWCAFQEQQKVIDLLRKQAKCHHTWHGKSENQYCSQCGLS